MFSKRALRWALIGSLTITIPDAKDPFVVAAKDAYNTRTGQSLTLTQYVKEVLRRGVVNDLTTQQQTFAQRTVTTKSAECQAEFLATQAAVDTYLNTQLGGW